MAPLVSSRASPTLPARRRPWPSRLIQHRQAQPCLRPTMTARRARILQVVATLLLAVLPFGRASGIDAPKWNGAKALESEYRRDWYECYREAERTVPAITVQSGAPEAVILAAVERRGQVGDLTKACMAARGYKMSPPSPSSAPSQPWPKSPTTLQP